MTLDELIAWVSSEAAKAASMVRPNRMTWGGVDVSKAYREKAATLTSVENALRRLAQIERDHGGEA